MSKKQECTFGHFSNISQPYWPPKPIVALLVAVMGYVTKRRSETICQFPLFLKVALILLAEPIGGPLPCDKICVTPSIDNLSHLL